VSSSLGSSPWQNTTVIPGDDRLADRVRAVKDGADGPVLVAAGSRTLAHFLLTRGLVDQLNLQVFPVILGSGFRVFPDTTDTIGLTLASSCALDGGVVLQSYRPAA